MMAQEKSSSFWKPSESVSNRVRQTSIPMPHDVVHLVAAAGTALELELVRA